MTDTLRLCILGNSHLGAAKEGWELIARDYRGVEPTFFGAPWDMMKGLEPDGYRLVPRNEKLKKKLRRTSDGLEEIRLDDYDAFLLYGLQFGPRRVLQVYRGFRPMSFEWPETLEDLPPMRRSVEPVQRVPERLFDKALQAALADTLAIRIAGMIRGGSNAPMALVAAPGFSERVLDGGEWDGVLGAEDLDHLARRYRDLAARVCPEDMALLLPRQSLSVHGLFTARAHAAADSADGSPDNVHTGPAYAAEMLRHAVSALRGRMVDDSADPGIPSPPRLAPAGA